MTLGLGGAAALDAVPDRQGGRDADSSSGSGARVCRAPKCWRRISLSINSAMAWRWRRLAAARACRLRRVAGRTASGTACSAVSGSAARPRSASCGICTRRCGAFAPDVIFAHATIPSFYARALPLSVPVVYVMHSATNDFERPLFRRVEHILSGRARAVIGVSRKRSRRLRAAIGRHPSMTRDSQRRRPGALRLHRRLPRVAARRRARSCRSGAIRR